MKRVLSLVLVLCLLTALGGFASAEGLRTSSYSSAESHKDMAFLFEDFERASTHSGGKATTAMVISALGRSFQVDKYIGTGTGSVIAENTPLLEQPYADSRILRSLSTKMILTVTDCTDGWYCVSVDGVTGYIAANTADIRYEAYPELSYGAWYAPYMVWGLESGILTEIRPEQKLTRSELASLLVIAADKLGCTLPEINAAYTFADTADFTAGLDAAVKLQRAGILLEKEDGTYAPNAAVSVSELQGVLLRFLANLSPAFNMRQIPVSTVSASAPVDESWFDDALFIGHSQVAGMSHHFNLPNIEYFCIIGHTAQEALDFPYYELSNGRMGTLQEGLELDQYGKVYIMLGINDCTDKDDQLDKFLTPMKQIIEMIQETQPNAEIYLLSLAPVGRQTPNNICYSLKNVVLFTQAVKSLAREYNTEYLDVFRLMADKNGYILDEYNAGDGIHIDAHHYDEILEFLKCHT